MGNGPSTSIESGHRPNSRYCSKCRLCREEAERKQAEQRRAAERQQEEQRRREAERQQAEQRRIEAELQQVEQRRIEAKRQQAEQRRIEAERREAESIIDFMEVKTQDQKKESLDLGDISQKPIESAKKQDNHIREKLASKTEKQLG